MDKNLIKVLNSIVAKEMPDVWGQLDIGIDDVSSQLVINISIPKISDLRYEDDEKIADIVADAITIIKKSQKYRELERQYDRIVFTFDGEIINEE